MIINYSTNEWSTVGLLDLSQVKTNILLVMLPSGHDNKTGHRRSFVKLSNYAKERGVSTFRFDLPYCGESKVYSDPINEIECIKEIICYIKNKYGFKYVNLLGHCSGAMKSLELAKRYPSLINDVILWHIVPYIYGDENDLIKPKLEVRKYLGYMFRQLVTSKKSLSDFIKVIGQFIKLLINIILFPFLLLNYYTEKNKIDRALEGQFKLTNNNRIIVILNPSKSHFKNLKEGRQYMDRRLKGMGFGNIKIIEVHQKIFSTSWQECAIHDSINQIKDGAEKIELVL